MMNSGKSDEDDNGEELESPAGGPSAKMLARQQMCFKGFRPALNSLLNPESPG